MADEENKGVPVHAIVGVEESAAVVQVGEDHAVNVVEEVQTEQPPASKVKTETFALGYVIDGVGYHCEEEAESVEQAKAQISARLQPYIDSGHDVVV